MNQVRSHNVKQTAATTKAISIQLLLVVLVAAAPLLVKVIEAKSEVTQTHANHVKEKTEIFCFILTYLIML